ncbi:MULTISPECIES: TetR/AcrR family transcriptional regulator [Streptomyces]|uniref:Regulatory protein, TetR n=1 Tax=Streptomyces venezuelae (strain ATCC 10712 / CBS 650.69 / DSM 40230 / JCM 4526 / NBRC 13096 / PD 04745) TaxID=953739 RepID=F2RE31_STRVP|nr:TetR/AcrR family transcriptional regulator [Streptomyces venezuelae]APE20654.1 TetR family transcriptional regulator [Streptomyces venezuelae]QER98043.1 TetR/AcrR family transcriptional regulator [Streptomyces venezuelae ATCC 10712]CCA54571.1 regulatory protein, TetR [Streptomyces venezuelae ATCC 10712]
MARTSGPETRDRLIRAAEELFAAQGVHGAQLRDVVARAGQANPSAVQYHFGSRAGLLDAVMAGRQARTEDVLAPLLAAAPDTTHALVEALVTAEASELRTDRGRRCLRISAQLSHESGIRTRTPHPTLAGTGYWRLIERIADRLAADGLPEPLLLERIDLALTVVGAALADRARQYLDGTEPLTGEALFLADLVETTTALLRAAQPRSVRNTRRDPS